MSYFTPIGATTQKGFDLDLAVEPVRGLQFVGAYYKGKVRNQAGALVPNTFQRSVSFFGRYEFRQGALRDASVGGGLARTSGRILSSAGLTTGIVPAPATLEMEPGTTVNMFASYRWQ